MDLLGFIAYLIAPLVDDGHVDVVNEDRHLLSSWWSVRRSHALVHVTLDRSLKTRAKKNNNATNIKKCNKI